MKYQTIKEANYTYIGMLGRGEHVLKDNNTQIKQLFCVNKNHASWGIKFKNTHLEFCRDLKTEELVKWGFYNK